MISVNAARVHRNPYSKSWEASFLTPDGKAELTIWKDNKVASFVGARLVEVIAMLEAANSDWKWNSGVTYDEDFYLKYTKETEGGRINVSSLDLSIQAYNLILKELNPSKYDINSVNLGKERTKTFYFGNKYDLVWEHLPGDRSWLVVGKGTVIDGDTIDVLISRRGNSLNTYDDFDEGKTIRIRYAGVDTAETLKNINGSVSEDADNRNNEISRKYKIDMDTTYQIGALGKQATVDILSIAGGTVIVDIDVKNNAPAKDGTGSRWMGVVYKTVYALADEALSDSEWYINANKSLLASSTQFTYFDDQGKERHVPLGFPSATYQYQNNNTKFDTINWEYVEGYDSSDKVQAIQAEDEALKVAAEKKIQEELARMRYDNELTTKTTHTYIIKKGDTLSSIVKEFAGKGYEVDKNTLISANNLLPDENGNFVLYPSITSIVVPIVVKLTEAQKQNEFVVGAEAIQDNTLNFFSGMDDRRSMTSPYHMRIGDVQFIIPPLSIQVNTTSSIEKVKTLRTKSSMMVKAGSSHQTISLQLYFHDLESINGYPVKMADGGYYYMDGLRSLIAQFKKAPFLPIENEYINEVMNIHDVILVNLNVATVPGFPHSIAATLILAQFDHEAYMPHVEFLDQQINYPMFRWYYQQTMRDQKNPYRSYLAPIEGELTNDFHFTIASESDLAERQDSVKELRFLSSASEFNTEYADGKNLLGRMAIDGERVSQALDQLNRCASLRVRKGKDFPSKFSPTLNKDVYEAIYGKNFSLANSDAFYLPMECTFGLISRTTDLIVLRVSAETNRAKIPKKLLITDVAMNNKNQDLYAFDPNNTTHLGYLVTINKSEIQANFQKTAYNVNYQKLQEKANSSEGTIIMEDYYVDNVLITSMNVTYENNFAQVSTQMGDHPTYQYMGSQDPYIQVTMETDDRNAIRSIRELIEKSDYYSKKYRLGISSGFVGFENQLTRLFGVNSVMIESCVTRTVPGFPNRFQIEMTLCGFDKTQKRSETLDGFAATDSTKIEERHVSTVEGRDPIVVERKMKDLELYPDLELPTYQELNNALGYIKAGIRAYHNPSGAKYVDPDFYISTSWTYRNYLKQYKYEKETGTETEIGLTRIQDYSGFVATTKLDSENIFDADDANMAMFNKLAQDTEAARNASTELTKVSFMSNQDSSETARTAFSTEEGSEPTTNWGGVGKTLQSSGQSVDSWMENFSNVTAFPTQTEIDAWTGVSGVTLQQFLVNPTKLEVYKEIYAIIDELFAGFVFDERKSSSKVVKEKLTYASMDDYAKASYLWLKHSGDPKWKNAPSISIGSIPYSDLNATKGMITRERAANILKSLLSQESGWEQLYHGANGYTAKLYPGESSSQRKQAAAGIGQITLIVHAYSVSEARRLTWDWKFNIRRMATIFKAQLKKMNESDDIQVRSRTWEWAVVAYNKPKNFKERKLKSEYYVPVIEKWFEGRYNSTEKKFATPSAKLDNSVYSYLNNVSSTAVALIRTDREAMIKEIIRFEQQYSVIIDQRVKDERVEKISDEILMKMYKIYSQSPLVLDKNPLVLSLETAKQAPKSDLQVYQEYTTVAKALGINNLKYNETPQETWRDMFTDMCEYDQRGRMLRAFPTFQMFIIDEGRWMANYRLWDNFYGFNAITSIDVHKSRNIAADTAVVKMTNIYSNLTSRRMEDRYGDWEYSIWDNFIFGQPTQELLNARTELVDGMFLQTGARIHLRLGYGSDATSLPVMFNGTITEMDTDDLITIIAQGDGIELTNVISADPDETNDAFMKKLTEPRDLLAKLMTSKGNWFKDAINYQSGGRFFKDNPLGILHFGNPVKTPGTNASIGSIFGWHITDAQYGEAVQNIYSSNGANTFSQWTYQDGASMGVKWNGFGFLPQWSGDEMDIEMKLYGQSTWDVAQTLAYTSPDYIAAVLPFETRSTLFFGKPYYRVAYRYDSLYNWNELDSYWERVVTKEVRKPFQQFHIYNSITDIIGNKIKASEDGVYTNIIARSASGEQSLLQQADFDIRYDKQKTKVIETNLTDPSPLVPDFWTIDKQLNYYAQSVLRDSVKDMYKGTLTVLGDPSVKPHDMCHMTDIVHEMNGPFLVKDVTHSFSLETGFITMITPDAVVVVDDMSTISRATWFCSASIGLSSYVLGKYLAARTMSKIMGTAAVSKAAQWTGSVTGNAMLRLASMLSPEKGDADFGRFKELLREYDDVKKPGAIRSEAKVIEEMGQVLEKMKGKVSTIEGTGLKKLGKVSRKGLVSVSEGIVKNLGEGKNAMNFLKVGGFLVGGPLIAVDVLAGLAVSYIAATWAEAFLRNKKARQAVMIMPMKYQQRNFTAGINGYAGSVVGSKPGKMDQFYMGAGYAGADDWTAALGKTLNYFFDNQSLNPFDEEAGLGSVDYYINSGERTESSGSNDTYIEESWTNNE
jgi:hypothetical protein